jgi:hypothetical protein
MKDLELVYKRFGSAQYNGHAPQFYIVIRTTSSRYKMNMEYNTDLIGKHKLLLHAQIRFRSMNLPIEIIKRDLAKRDSNIESYRYVWQI